MSLKKLLGIISVVIIVVFSMMLTTSYAWYSFENASTTFEGMTSVDDVIISYHHGEYINTSIAVPIKSEQVNQYSEKNNFSIDVKNSAKNEELLVTVSLVDISIARALQNSAFKIELYHQGDSVATIAGNTVGTGGATTKTLGNIVLDSSVTNNFEVRLYILDDGTDQSAMMDKTFQAKIQIDVVSRLKSQFNDYANPDIYISNITIDGEDSDYLPTSGYYSMSSSCTKAGSNTLIWDPLAKTITYPVGAQIQDSCSLTFTSSTDYPLLSEMEPGSYVKYIGTNGCDGKYCEGQNANYVNETDMGYCYKEGNKFNVNGWRIGYIENDSAYLISAGAPECVSTYGEGVSSDTVEISLAVYYYYGSGYAFDEVTGLYTLTGVTASRLNFNSNYVNIIANTPYTCASTDATGTCEHLYKVLSYNGSNLATVNVYKNFERTLGVPKHLANLDNKALKYCNSDYAKDGVCYGGTAWAMDATDFFKITGNILSTSSCLKDGSFGCGYTNDLIDNGGYYWFANAYSNSAAYAFYWAPDSRYVYDARSNFSFGVRPVLKLESSVYVVGGSGIYEDPYIISK